jgi:hypothetical protein
VLDCQRRLEHASESCGAFGMTKDGFDRSNIELAMILVWMLGKESVVYRSRLDS